MKKKILIVTSVWGFLAKFCKEDVGILQELGYEVHYASNKNNPIYQFPEDIYSQMNVIFHDIDIWQSPFGISHNFTAIKQVREIIRKNEINVMHCHTPSGGLVARLAGIGFPVHIIYTAHGFHFYKGAGKIHNLIYHTIENFLSFFTDVIVTVNHEDYEAAKKMHTRKGVALIPGVGLDRNYFHETTLEQRKKSRKQLSVDSKFFIVSIGELRENKNPKVIIEALSFLKEKGNDISNVQYGLIGAGRQEQELKELAKKKGVAENVRFYGYQTDVRPYLMAADTLAFPTIREGLGMAALEALAMGVPVLASDNRGTREFMVNEKNGYVCKENIPEKYAEYILQIYKERNKWGTDMEKRAVVRKSTEPFDKHKTAVVMRKVYESATD